MRKSTMRFKQFFQKLHKDNLLRSPYHNQILGNGTSTLLTSKSINFNVNMKQPFSSRVKENKQIGSRRTLSARLPSSKVSKPLHKQIASQSVKSFCQYIQRIQKEVKKSLKQNSDIQIKTTIVQFKKLQQLCQNMEECDEWMGQRLKQFEEDLSKHLQLRITRIIFYFIYSKFLQCSSKENKKSLELKLLQLCQQYSRILNIFSLSLYACAKIQKIHNQEKNYSQSKTYARKTLRLAVYLKDATEEYKAIQALKILGFYTGAVTNNKQNFLSKEERQSILKKFHPTDDLPVSYKSQQIDNSLGFTKYEVEEFVGEQDVKISKNIQKFVSNFALMSKDLTDRSKHIMKTIKKVNRIGCVNKYLDSGNFISLQPRSRNMPTQNRGQVLLTHSRKKSQLQSCQKFHKFYLPKIRQMISSIIAQYRQK